MPKGQRSPDRQADSVQHGSSRIDDLSIGAGSAELRRALEWLEAVCRQRDVPQVSAERLALCLHEALANVIAHGGASALAAPSGTRLIDSTPPATTTSCCPDMTACTAKSRACWLDPHARFTEVPGMLSGQPAARTELRAMFAPCSFTCVTQPMTTSSTSSFRTPDLVAR